jgi:biotin transport system substrate-specific component
MGSAAAALYLLAGALGLPVFAGASGGIAHFAGPTGGFLVGYFFIALLSGLIAGRPDGKTAAGGTGEAGGETETSDGPKKTPQARIVLAAVLGILVVYIPGVIWLRRVMDSWPAALIGGFFPFLPGDAIKAALAIIISPRLRRIIADHLG